VALLREQAGAKPGALDGLQVLLGDDHVGVDVDHLQRRGNAFERSEFVHGFVPDGFAARSIAKPRAWEVPSYGAGLDRLHVGVRQAEMMADLVHQDVRDDRAERFVVLGPVVEDRPAVEPDHVGHLHRGAFRAEGHADSLEQAEQVEFGLGLEVVENIVGREILDPDDEAFAERAEFFRQPAIGFRGDYFDLFERGRLGRSPGQWIGKWGVRHGGVLGQGRGPAKATVKPLTAARRWASLPQELGREATMRSGITVVFTAVVFWLAAPYTMLVAQERGVAARAAHAQAQPKAKRPPTRLRVTP